MNMGKKILIPFYFFSAAFWGESDDSSSELEAALRPRAHSAEADEFDDFYE